ncbi:MotE family protein [Methylobacterium sp. Leaf118]|uniref:MotE family protein n=1 Tax=Methylobacterium sp. Leaf118 TaxID=2876562 RepID=UPI001E33BA35|nr:MotE family protein [Methylobacterium sp. Leaf118]
MRLPRTLALWLLLSGAALAAGGGDKPDPAKEAALKALAVRDAPKEVSAQDFVAREPAKTGYCANIADAAADARFAWQKEQLAALERQVEERIKALEEKRAEYEIWLKRRNEFLAKADDSVVAVYAKMRPDAAALQFANMPEDSAAALLTKLNARAASAILSEMEATRAANLARKMTDAGRKDAPAGAPPAPKKNERS